MMTIPWTSTNSARPATLVQMSRLELTRARDIPGFLVAALRIRRATLKAPGAAGVSLRAAPLSRTFWTLSSWTDQDAITAFVASDTHIAVMNKYRDRWQDRTSTRGPRPNPAMVARNGTTPSTATKPPSTRRPDSAPAHSTGRRLTIVAARPSAEATHVDTPADGTDVLCIGTPGLGLVLDEVHREFAPSGGCEPEKHEGGSRESDDVLIGEAADPLNEFRARDGGDLVDHESARLADPRRLASIDGYSKQWRIGLVGRERADHDRCCCIEEIVLNDHDRTRFAGVSASGGRGPDLAASHSSSPSASMNA